MDKIIIDCRRILYKFEYDIHGELDEKEIKEMMFKSGKKKKELVACVIEKLNPFVGEISLEENDLASALENIGLLNWKFDNFMSGKSSRKEQLEYWKLLATAKDASGSTEDIGILLCTKLTKQDLEFDCKPVNLLPKAVKSTSYSKVKFDSNSIKQQIAENENRSIVMIEQKQKQVDRVVEKTQLVSTLNENLTDKCERLLHEVEPALHDVLIPKLLSKPELDSITTSEIDGNLLNKVAEQTERMSVSLQRYIRSASHSFDNDEV